MLIIIVTPLFLPGRLLKGQLLVAPLIVIGGPGTGDGLGGLSGTGSGNGGLGNGDGSGGNGGSGVGFGSGNDSQSMGFAVICKDIPTPFAISIA